MKPTKADKLPITKRALAQRINRKLANKDRRLVFDRSSEQLHLVDLKTLSVVLRSVDLEALGNDSVHQGLGSVGARRTRMKTRNSTCAGWVRLSSATLVLLVD